MAGALGAGVLALATSGCADSDGQIIDKHGVSEGEGATARTAEAIELGARRHRIAAFQG